MLTVFSVLIIIWISLVIFKLFCYDIPNARSGKTAKKPKKVKAKKPSKKDLAVQSPEPAPAPAPSADTALIAAITAAIMEERRKAGVGGGFRVVSFRRK